MEADAAEDEAEEEGVGAGVDGAPLFTSFVSAAAAALRGVEAEAEAEAEVEAAGVAVAEGAEVVEAGVGDAEFEAVGVVEVVEAG